MSIKEFDAVVIGAGIIGSSCGLKLAENGKKTLILEQHSVGHPHGSSHGASRIIRHSHDTDIYMALAVDAIEEWNALEKKTGTQLYLRNGLLWLGNEEGTKRRSNLLSKYGIEHLKLNGNEIHEKFGHLHYDKSKSGEEWHAVYEPKAGTMLADKCLKDEFVTTGGFLNDNEKVVKLIYDSKDKIQIQTTKSRYLTKYLIIAAGAWLQNLLPIDIIAEGQLIGVNFWQIKKPELVPEFKNSPNLMITELDEHLLFMIPCVDYPDKAKFGIHLGIKFDPFDGTIKRETPEWMHLVPGKHISTHIPGLKSDHPVTNDQNFILDRYPLNENILIAGGMSGTGFKFALTIGKIIAQMANDASTKMNGSDMFDLKPFKINRETALKSKL